MWDDLQGGIDLQPREDSVTQSAVQGTFVTMTAFFQMNKLF